MPNGSVASIGPARPTGAPRYSMCGFGLYVRPPSPIVHDVSMAPVGLSRRTSIVKLPPTSQRTFQKYQRLLSNANVRRGSQSRETLSPAIIRHDTVPAPPP